MLLHSDISGYDLPAINFVLPSEEAQESHIPTNKMLIYLYT